MIDDAHVRVLKIVYERLKNTHIVWVVTGSLGFALQGLSIDVGDVDVQTDEAGVYALEQLFAEYVARSVAFSEFGKLRSHYGALEIEGMNVDIMGDIEKRLPDGSWDPPPDLLLHRRFVDMEGMRIPVLSLAYDYQAYRMLGWAEKLEQQGIRDLL